MDGTINTFEALNIHSDPTKYHKIEKYRMIAFSTDSFNIYDQLDLQNLTIESLHLLLDIFNV